MTRSMSVGAGYFAHCFNQQSEIRRVARAQQVGLHPADAEHPADLARQVTMLLQGFLGHFRVGPGCARPRPGLRKLLLDAGGREMSLDAPEGVHRGGRIGATHACFTTAITARGARVMAFLRRQVLDVQRHSRRLPVAPFCDLLCSQDLRVEPGGGRYRLARPSAWDAPNPGDIMFLSMCSPPLSWRKDHPAVQPPRAFFAAAARLDANRRRGTLDDVAQADFLVRDEPGQPHAMC